MIIKESLQQAIIIDNLLESNNIGSVTFEQFSNYFNTINLFNFTEQYEILNEEEKNGSDKLASHEQRLRNAGFDLGKFKKDLRKIIDNKIAGFKNTTVDDKDLKSKLSSLVANIKQAIKNFISNAVSYFKDKEKLKQLGKDVAISYILAITVAVINTAMLAVLQAFIPGLATSIVTCITGPLTEEIGKRIADKLGKGDIYNKVFNAFEANNYIQQFLAAGCSLPKAVLVRIPAIIMHTVNQKLIKHAGANETDEKVKNKKKNIMGLITFALHAAFNVAGLKGNDQIIKFLTR